jgi:hypothetical protein
MGYLLAQARRNEHARHMTVKYPPGKIQVYGIQI